MESNRVSPLVSEEVVGSRTSLQVIPAHETSTPEEMKGGAEHGVVELLSFDIGGTTAKLCLLTDDHIQ